MGLNEDLWSVVKSIFGNAWTERNGSVVPEPEKVKMGNDAVKLSATVLYADISGSTKMVDTYPAWFAAEIYKAYLHCAAKIVRSEDGVITAYDGDRLMAVFIGEYQHAAAVRTALKINYARKNIVNPALKERYPKVGYEVKHSIGVDTSELFVAQTGIRGFNDLVWVGRAANHAAKLAALSSDYPSRITADVYDKLPNTLRRYEGRDIWTSATWTAMNDRPIYRSVWTWKI